MKANKFEGKLALKIIFGGRMERRREGGKEMTRSHGLISIKYNMYTKKKKSGTAKVVMFSLSGVQLRLDNL